MVGLRFPEAPESIVSHGDSYETKVTVFVGISFCSLMLIKRLVTVASTIATVLNVGQPTVPTYSPLSRT